jgi:hypothetical protein
MHTQVLPHMQGSPQEAWSRLDKSHPRALEFACQIVEQAIAENRGADTDDWVAEMEDKCKDKLKEIVHTPPVEPTREKLPSIDPPEEDLAEIKADEEAVRACVCVCLPVILCMCIYRESIDPPEEDLAEIKADEEAVRACVCVCLPVILCMYM